MGSLHAVQVCARLLLQQRIRSPATLLALSKQAPQMRLLSMLLLTCVVATGCGQMSKWRKSGASATTASPPSPQTEQTAQTPSPAPDVRAARRAAEAPNAEVSRVAMLLSQLIETEGTETGDNSSQPGSGETASHAQLAGTTPWGRSDSNPLQSDQTTRPRADQTSGSAAHQLATSNQAVGRGNQADVSRSANTREIPSLTNDLSHLTDESNRGPGQNQSPGIPEDPISNDSGNQREIQLANAGSDATHSDGSVAASDVSNEIQQLSLRIESLQPRIGQRQKSPNRSSELLESETQNPNSSSGLSGNRANRQAAREHSAPELTRDQIQRIAIQSAIDHEESRGWIVERVNSQERRFDLISRKPHAIDPSISIDVRFIAVQGQAESRELVVQTREVELSKEYRGDFWIYSVTNCATEPRVVPIQNPSEDSLRPVYEIRHYVYDPNGGSQESSSREKPAASKNDAPHLRRSVAIPLNQ